MSGIMSDVANIEGEVRPLISAGRFEQAEALVGLLLISLVTGCAALDRGAHADPMAAPAGLKRELINTSGFVLTTYARIS